ncbi:hypothetical protein [Daejeonella sp. JGW-45]|uniref:hypothetical protein n=1 Tax=Daejeonella sp. JGW-45 TaxID=3034148 RepID=UPI0023EAD28F|nr:hypothetical protein [Daejeonella sp. JGW-45]
MNKILFSAIALVFATTAMAQLPKIPAAYSNLGYDTNGRLYFKDKDEKYFAEEFKNPLTTEQLLGKPKGTENGVQMDFGTLKGTVTYGLIPSEKFRIPFPYIEKPSKLKTVK